MSNPPNELPRYVTCRCQHCDGHIEFDASGLREGETRRIECPHCQQNTNIFVPARLDVPKSPAHFYAVSQPKTSALAIWSLVLGILSPLCCVCFTGIPAVICGHMTLSKIRYSGGALTGRNMAIAGLVTGYLGNQLDPTGSAGGTPTGQKPPGIVRMAIVTPKILRLSRRSLFEFLHNLFHYRLDFRSRFLKGT